MIITTQENLFDVFCPSPLMKMSWSMDNCEDFDSGACGTISVEEEGYYDEETTVILTSGSKATVFTASSVGGLFYTVDFKCCQIM